MATVNEALQAAFDHLQAGRADAAAELSQRILDASPGQHTAHYLLGIIAAQRGEIDRAISHFRGAVAGNPTIADYHLNLGKAEWAGGDHGAAMASWRTARSLLHPQHPAAGQVAQWLGGALRDAGRQAYGENRLDDAVALLTEALDCLPMDALAVLTLGSIRQDQEQWEEAVAAYDRVIALDANMVAARINRGILARQRCDETAARRWWRSALAVDPASSTVWGMAADGEPAGWRRAIASRLPSVNSGDWSGLALALANAGDPAAAVRGQQVALAIDPDSAVAWNNLGNLISGSTPDAAAVAYGRALQLDPRCLPAIVGLAGVEVTLGQPGEALHRYRSALAFDPRSVAAHGGVAECLRDLGDIDGAVKAGQAALAFAGVNGKDDDVIRFGVCLAQLTRGRLADGWKDYHLRWSMPSLAGGRRDFPLPRWRGEPNPGGRLLIWPEQGLGDEILFLGMLPAVLASGVPVTVESDPRLHPLLARTYADNGIDWLARGATAQQGSPPGVAAHIAMGDLPALFRRQWADFTESRPYLTADPSAVAAARKRLSAESPTDNNPFVVGISWQSRNKRYGAVRSLPLTDLVDALALPGGERRAVRLVNLQYGVGDLSDDPALSGAGIFCDPLVDIDQDIDGLAALMAACDLVVTVDNTTAHLAGALGLPAWVLLPAAADWRWFRDREDSPWYPATRLFRQPVPGDWHSVLGALTAALTAVVDGDRGALRPPVWTPPEEAEEFDRAMVERNKYRGVWTQQRYREFSPGAFQAVEFDLLGMLARYGARTVLDAGCGSGKTSRHLIVNGGGAVKVFGFDIADNCLDPFFDDIKDRFLTVGCLWERGDFRGVYDAVVCTDVLEHIPTDKVPDVLANLRAVSRKLAFLGIALFDDYFGPHALGEPLHLTVKPVAWWLDRLAEAGFNVEKWSTLDHPGVSPAWLMVEARPI